MGFKTHIEASESWDPVQQTLTDIADLLLENLGKLECRPVQKDENFVYIPPEVQSNRIGYVAVAINKSLQSAELLGFFKETSIDNLPINQLQPLEKLLEYLESLESTRLKNTISSEKRQVNLTKWFENIFEVDWQTIESILLAKPGWQFRSGEEDLSGSVERAKLIDFGIKANRESVGIVVNISRDKNNFDDLNIIVSLYPGHENEYLPPLLHVMILDDEGTAVMEAKTKNDNRKIELEFSASRGDLFSIKIVLGDVSAIENFAI
ncbi:hypothetical protein BC008_18675 [Mastigocoleus testarum BC008]|uniref:DUF1822 domain-containing protein n=2 Tax=Mastigocoleus TaxID=996924 RepID=A0A0V7ZKH3_9CYAN|nr:hypothetical protein BC008_37845 [Mastigocoleus testarum BC008]KST64855.1 hypothetical protein BC008_18675 [Mastigocoleus testarum BC008]